MEEAKTKSNPAVVIGCIGAAILCLTAATGTFMYKNMKSKNISEE